MRFPDLLHLVGQRRLTAEGDLTDVSAAQWMDLRTSVFAHARNDSTRLGEIARRYLGVAKE